jgi:hypothetical protein
MRPHKECTPVIPVSVIPIFSCPSATSPNVSYPSFSCACRRRRPRSGLLSVMPVGGSFISYAVMPAGGPCQELVLVVPAKNSIPTQNKNLKAKAYIFNQKLKKINKIFQFSSNYSLCPLLKLKKEYISDT